MHTPRLPTCRRRFLALCGSAAGSLVWGAGRVAAAPRTHVLETKVISLDAQHYHGWPTVVRCRSGLQSESPDGGRTWSVPHPIGVWGLPSHLLRLRDGRLLMTYGHRRPPLGNQARLSDDEGRTWSEPVVLSADGASDDLGYPSTVELADGTLLTVWYEALKGDPMAVLRQARWRLAE